MGFKPIRYNNGEGLVKIEIEDDTGRNIENWTIMMSDIGTWFEVMKQKYGNTIDKKKVKISNDKDLDWLR